MRALLILALSSLAACGFHLAGSRPLPAPLKSVYIQLAASYVVSEQPVETALRALLQRRGARVEGSAQAARTVIRLSDLHEGRQVLSLGSDGKALEYELITRLRYEVTSNGRPLLAPGVLQVTREYSFNAQQVLAKEAEEERLRAFIQSELAELLMLRIEASAGAMAPDSAPAVTPGAVPR